MNGCWFKRGEVQYRGSTNLCVRFTCRTRMVILLVELLYTRNVLVYFIFIVIFFTGFVCVKSTTGDYRVHCDRLIFFIDLI